MPVLNMAKVDTTPGSSTECPFSPPKGWDGNSDDYLNLMRFRYHDRMYGQRLIVAARFGHTHFIEITGPFSKEAAVVINKLNEKFSLYTNT